MIRLADVADIPAILDIYGPYVLNTAYSFEYTVPSREAFTERFLHHTSYCPWLVWEEDGKVLGYAYGVPPFERAAYSWCVEVSVYLAPEIHGRGIGKRLYTALEQLLFRQGYQVIYSVVTSRNTASIAFHEAVGYKRFAEFAGCGVKFNQWQGTVWLEKRQNSVDIPTNMPTRWSDVVKNDENLKNILAILSLS